MIKLVLEVECGETSSIKPSKSVLIHKIVKLPGPNSFGKRQKFHAFLILQILGQIGNNKPKPP
jgi:hypothetical protein